MAISEGVCVCVCVCVWGCVGGVSGGVCVCVQRGWVQGMCPERVCVYVHGAVHPLLNYMLGYTSPCQIACWDTLPAQLHAGIHTSTQLHAGIHPLPHPHG